MLYWQTAGLSHCGTLALDMQQALEMTLRRRGLYRFPMPAGIQNYVLVENIADGSDQALPESVYRAQGYTPAFDVLPWHDHFSRGPNRHGRPSLLK